jgi:hypothetical protein
MDHKAPELAAAADPDRPETAPYSAKYRIATIAICVSCSSGFWNGVPAGLLSPNSQATLSVREAHRTIFAETLMSYSTSTRM